VFLLLAHVYLQNIFTLIHCH